MACVSTCVFQCSSCAGAAGKPDNVPECLQKRTDATLNAKQILFIKRWIRTRQIDTAGDGICTGLVLDRCRMAPEARWKGDEFVKN